jgi:hypothetical protein
VQLEPGRYEANWFNAGNGRQVKTGPADAPRWVSPDVPDHGDWTLLVKRM